MFARLLNKGVKTTALKTMRQPMSRLSGTSFVLPIISIKATTAAAKIDPNLLLIPML